MKKFDEILIQKLREAYEAGYDRGMSDEVYHSRGTDPDPARTPPSFKDWLSGLFDPQCGHENVSVFGRLGVQYSKCLDCGQRLDETDE